MNDKRGLLKLFNENTAWEKRAEEGIEKNRKGDLKISIKDKNGNPIQNAKIHAKQITHEFRFGANLFLLDELETEEKNKIYKEKFADVFNMATLPFYWKTLEPERGKTRYEKDSEKIYRRPPIDLCIEFCEEHGIEPREHALAYAAFFPDWITPLSIEDTKKELERRYREVSERYADKIPTIEVTNEMIWTDAPTKFYNDPEYIPWCFKKAEEYFPNNELVINEATPFCFGENCRNTDRYYSYVEAAILKGARIDAIGMQFHQFINPDNADAERKVYYSPDDMFKHLDFYSTLDRPLQITEVTISAFSSEDDDEQVQAKLLENFYKIWFSHPNVEQIVYWNTVDGYAHVDNATPENIRQTQGDMTVGENVFHGGLLHFDMSEKPAYKKIKELIKTVWHTDEKTVTDDKGDAALRGFYGDYIVTVELNGERVEKKVTLSSKKDNNLEITL